MRDVRRIRMHCILLVFLIVVLALAGCVKKQSGEENDRTGNNESAVHILAMLEKRWSIRQNGYRTSVCRL